MKIIIFCLLIAIYIDIILLKKRDRPVFIKTFVVSPIKVLLGFLIVLVILLFSEDKWGDLPPLILLFILPMYLLRRYQFALRSEYTADPSLRLRSSALGVIVAWTYGIIVFGLLLSGITDLFPNGISEMGDLLISAVFSSALIIVLVYYSSKQFSDKGFFVNVGLSKGKQSWAKVIGLPVILGLLFAGVSSYLTVARQVQPQTPLNEVIDATQSASLILIFLFLAICMAPLVEEIVFRGYFFHVIKEWIGVPKAIYVIALTFAFLHVGQYFR